MCLTIVSLCSIWTAKFTVSEFLKRLTSTIWKKSYESVLHGIRIFLIVTFIAVVIATLGECQPFDHYWQVTPDPGARCRRGYAQLITMGAADIITDVLLIVFPIPIIIKSAMPLKRKMSLVLLFGLSLILIVITAYRVPAVISQRGRQQYRTVWASGEILAAAAVSNALVLGGFVRDRGIKKNKYKFGSASDSIDRQSGHRQTLTHRQWGSDEDLVRDTGYLVNSAMNDMPAPLPRPAPVAIPALPGGKANLFADSNWQFPISPSTMDSRETDGMTVKGSTDIDRKSDTTAIRVVPPRHDLSFFDLGGLLEDNTAYSITTSPVSTTSAHRDFASPKPSSNTFLNDIGGLLSPTGRNRAQTLPSSDHQPRQSWSHLHTDGQISPRSPNFPQHGHRPGSHSLNMPRQDRLQSLQDVGGLLADDAPLRGSEDTITSRTLTGALTPEQNHPAESLTEPPAADQMDSFSAAESSSSSPRPSTVQVQRANTAISLQDVGGLLADEHQPRTG